MSGWTVPPRNEQGMSNREALWLVLRVVGLTLALMAVCGVAVVKC